MKHGWEIKKLGEVCKLYQPQTISGEMLEEEGRYLVYGANGVIGRYNDYNHEESEVLLTCRGATCGSINMSEPYSWINGNAMVVKPVDKYSISQSFLRYYLESVDWSEVITGAAQPQITRQSLSPLSIQVPPIAEQEKIVAELDCLSGIIEKKKHQLKELDNLAQSVFYEMFGDPVENDKGWDVKKFPECYKLTSGKNLTAKKIIEGDYPVYGGNGIVGYHNDYNLNGENIIIGRVGALCGNVRNVLGKAYITDNAFILSKIENCWVNVFILHLLERHNLRQYARDALQPVVSNTGFKNIDIIIPPISLQQNFASKIESIEKQKELIAKSIKETETLFNSRMDYYFN